MLANMTPMQMEYIFVAPKLKSNVQKWLKKELKNIAKATEKAEQGEMEA
jgi:hypothetical protein